MNLYTKVDADVSADVAAAAAGEEEVNFSEAARLDLIVSFDDKDQVKSRGAHWDKKNKKWHITGEQFAADEDFWNQWTPSVVETVSADTDCPF